VDGREFWSTGGTVIRFIETLCLLTNGRWTGERFVLMPWQKRLLYELFEVDGRTGLRVYRRALIGLPRKSGKTEVLAAILLYLMLADGEKSAAVYCAAASEEQADMVFDAAKRMCEMDGAPLGELVEVQVSRLSKRGDPYSFMQRLTSKGRTKHGLNPHAVGLDELHAWAAGEGEELWAALNTGSAARQQPMQIAITTAGLDLEESRCGQMYQLGRAIERGEQPHGGFFFRWWQAPEGMDYRDPEYPRLASPSYGHTVDEGFYLGELGSVPESVYRRLYGNEWIDYGESPWVTREQMAACRLPWFPLACGAGTWVGVDLSETRDSTAVVWGQWVADDARPCGHAGEPCLYVHARTWEQPRRPDGRYDHEWEVPQAEVKMLLRDLSATYDVVTNVFDPWHSKLLRQDLEAEGLTCEEIHQTGARRSGASAGLYDMIAQQRLHYCDDVFERHCLNATAKATGTEGGYYLAKRRKGRVMDAAMAAVNVVYGLQNAEHIDTGGWVVS
jgi:phage terminase large subunit-like protein